MQIHRLHGPDLDDTRIIDEHVDGTEALARVLDHAIYLGLVGHVTGHRQHINAPLAEFVARAVQLVRVASAQDQSRVVRGQFAGEHESEPARTARQQDNLALEIVKPQAPAHSAQGDIGTNPRRRQQPGSASPLHGSPPSANGWRK